MAAAGIKSDMLYLEKLDFERRMAVERDLEKQWDLTKTPTLKQRKEMTEQGVKPQEPSPLCVMPSLGFDESDSFLHFGTPVGIKIYCLRSGQFVKVIGKVESTERFL